MKRAGVALVVLVLLNGTIASMHKGLLEERRRLETRLAENQQTEERRAAEAERERSRRELIDRARNQGLPRHLGIGAIRTLLVKAQRGLAIDRLSLEFRPTEVPDSGADGSQVSANLVGSFEALYDYLGRVESLRIPLAPEAMSLQRDVSGALGLTIRWTARWGEVEEPDPNEIVVLRSWLDRELSPNPGRDLFSEATAAPEQVTAEIEAPPTPAVDEPVRTNEEAMGRNAPPALIGFVLARPELESDIRRRVLAALRYEGEVHLVGVDEHVGEYKVVSIEARERVELRDTVTGERLVLELR